jgi:hypothetical protein
MVAQIYIAVAELLFDLAHATQVTIQIDEAARLAHKKNNLIRRESQHSASFCKAIDLNMHAAKFLLVNVGLSGLRLRGCAI